ncbi:MULTISPECIES: Rha family transcriptional regulator [Pseudomonas]|uniref:Rha family transcriptional regulator n=1 Tax=Pseudomonas juntendi TaxID=2666183 RepID=A0AAJ5V0E4_9PSED|nr:MULTISPECIES: Rha family transcriptional regulator [Pseudomonas]PYC07911.1 Rha protein [Pseudomonas sp. MB-090624]QOH71656.1 Rha family transcriptional regulator [Pseudomonas putida]WEA19951.1 Rha family transcriptional regulator [Pseudomonas juntendi]
MTDLILTEVDYGELVTCGGDEPTTDSVRVAKRFGKRHDNVLRAIDNVKCSANFRLLNFEETSYIDEQGKVQRMFNMTKDGFMFVVMGFTGEKAAAWKEAFIEAFNRMARELQDRSLSIEQQRHMLVAEFKQEKGLASLAGKTMRRWQLKKPVIEGKIIQLEKDGQQALQLH